MIETWALGRPEYRLGHNIHININAFESGEWSMNDPSYPVIAQISLLPMVRLKSFGQFTVITLEVLMNSY